MQATLSSHRSGIRGGITKTLSPLSDCMAQRAHWQLWPIYPLKDEQKYSTQIIPIHIPWNLVIIRLMWIAFHYEKLKKALQNELNDFRNPLHRSLPACLPGRRIAPTSPCPRPRLAAELARRLWGSAAGAPGQQEPAWDTAGLGTQTAHHNLTAMRSVCMPSQTFSNSSPGRALLVRFCTCHATVWSKSHLKCKNTVPTMNSYSYFMLFPQAGHKTKPLRFTGLAVLRWHNHRVIVIWIGKQYRKDFAAWFFWAQDITSCFQSVGVTGVI